MPIGGAYANDKAREGLLFLQRMRGHFDSEVLTPVQIANTRCCALEGFSSFIKVECVQIEGDVARVE